MKSSQRIIIAIVLPIFSLFMSQAQTQTDSYQASSNNSEVSVSSTPQSNTTTPKIFEFDAQLIEAETINYKEVCASIEYPYSASQLEIEGTVAVRVLVSEKGAYIKHVIVSSPHKMLSEAVESQLQKLSFHPAIKKGRMVESWKTVAFHFRILG